MFEGDVIKTTQHFPFHLLKGPCTASNAETEFRSTPVLLNEVQFTVVLGIKITQVTTRLDMLLKQRLLRHEIGLGVKEMSAATVGLLFGATGTSALGRETALRPKAALANNALHPLEPPWITRVVVGKIERLSLACQGIEAVAHAWAVRNMCPEALGISGAHR